MFKNQCKIELLSSAGRVNVFLNRSFLVLEQEPFARSFISLSFLFQSFLSVPFFVFLIKNGSKNGSKERVYNLERVYIFHPFLLFPDRRIPDRSVQPITVCSLFVLLQIVPICFRFFSSLLIIPFVLVKERLFPETYAQPYY